MTLRSRSIALVRASFFPGEIGYCTSISPATLRTVRCALTGQPKLSSPNRQRVPLNEGLYAVASPPGAGLAIEGGVVILPSGGEDPWPVPPSKQLVQQLRSLISAEFEKLKQRPL
ncbi:MAG: hypothetical protein IPI49_05190 [Myxococcales bacterium]|nr:hypothetical protein [Myxococcales bacterium]